MVGVLLVDLKTTVLSKIKMIILKEPVLIIRRFLTLIIIVLCVFWRIFFSVTIGSCFDQNEALDEKALLLKITFNKGFEKKNEKSG
jgi:hypothetical protein